MAGLFPDSPRTHVKAGFKSRDWISIFCKDLWVFFFLSRISVAIYSYPYSKLTTYSYILVYKSNFETKYSIKISGTDL